jgi:hypothetical protein
MSKQKIHNKILVVLSSGNQVSVEDIKQSFASDPKVSGLLYRLSTYIYDARKYESAVIKVFKDGRKVTGYQLVNFKDYTSEGFFSPYKELKLEGHQEAVQA